ALRPHGHGQPVPGRVRHGPAVRFPGGRRGAEGRRFRTIIAPRMSEGTRVRDAEARPVVRIGHSHDPDDAFMFYGLASGKVPAAGYVVEQVLSDIESLNRLAMRGEIEVTAVSIHAYAYLADRYLLLPCGASMGDGYGPVVIARRPMDLEELATTTVAVPGRLTSAALALRLALGEVPTEVMPFDAILPAVARGEREAGLLIHEGQLTYG